MGIINYFKYISTTYPQVVKRNQAPDRKIDCLFYDANGLIYKNISKCSSEEEIYKEFCEEIRKQNEFIKPNKVYVILDGIPCYSKLQQQRNRRFMSQFKNQQLFTYCKKNMKMEDYEKETWFDRNKISVGTDFMKNLSIYFKNYIKENGLEDYITFLNDMEEGEAEHKIFQIIKRQKQNSDTVYAINGLDSDLIQLVLFNLQEYTVYVVREDGTFIDTVLLKEVILNDIEECYNINIDIKEYVVLTMLFGNDFLPRLSFLHFDDKIYDFLYKSYEECVVKTGSRIIYKDETNRYRINYTFMKWFFERLQTEENQRYQEYLKEFYSEKKNGFHYSDTKGFLKVLEMSPKTILNGTSNIPSISKIKNKYNTYYYIQGMNEEEQQKIKYMCFNYLAGLQFNLDYYQYNYTNSGYVYKYEMSPFMECLYNTLQEYTHEIDTIIYEELVYTVRITPELLQMFIMPYSSRQLVPEKYHRMYNDPKYNVLQYFPTQFQINIFLKTYLHECSPQIPQLDLRTLIRAKLKMDVDYCDEVQHSNLQSNDNLNL